MAGLLAEFPVMLLEEYFTKLPMVALTGPINLTGQRPTSGESDLTMQITEL